MPVLGHAIWVAPLDSPVSTAADFTTSRDVMAASAAAVEPSPLAWLCRAGWGRLSVYDCVRAAQADYWKLPSTTCNAFKGCLPHPCFDNTLQISGLKFRDLRGSIGW